MNRLIAGTLLISVLFSIFQTGKSSTAEQVLETFEPSIRNDYIVDADVFGRYFSAVFIKGAVSTEPDKRAHTVKSYFDGVNSLTVSPSSMVLNHGEVVVTLDNQLGVASITTEPAKQHVAVVNVGLSRKGTVNDINVPNMSPPVRSYMCLITTPSHAELKYIRAKILPILRRDFTLKRLNKGAFIGCAQIAQTPARKRNLSMDLLSKKMPQSVPVFKPPKPTNVNSKMEREIPQSMIFDYFLSDDTEESLSDPTPSHNMNDNSMNSMSVLPSETPEYNSSEAVNSSPTFESSSPDILSPSAFELPGDPTFLGPSTDWLQRITVFRGVPPPGGLIKRYSIEIRADLYVEQTEKGLILLKDDNIITLIMSNDGFDINAGIDEDQTSISRLLDLDQLFTEVKFAQDEYGLNAIISSRDISGQEVEQESFSIDENVCFAIDVATRAVAQRAISFPYYGYYQDQIVICIAF